jgi:lactoylglutathione lyase
MPLTTGHVGINVTNLDRASDFYQAALGLTRTGGSDAGPRRYAFLGDGERLVLTLWEQGKGRFDAARPGLHHLSFQLASLDDVRTAEKRLLGLGTPFVYDGVVPHGEGSDSGGIFFEDPDGTRIELFTVSGLAGTKAPHSDAPSCGFF